MTMSSASRKNRALRPLVLVPVLLVAAPLSPAAESKKQATPAAAEPTASEEKSWLSTSKDLLSKSGSVITGSAKKLKFWGKDESPAKVEPAPSTEAKSAEPAAKPNTKKSPKPTTAASETKSGKPAVTEKQKAKSEPAKPTQAEEKPKPEPTSAASGNEGKGWLGKVWPFGSSEEPSSAPEPAATTAKPSKSKPEVAIKTKEGSKPAAKPAPEPAAEAKEESLLTRWIPFMVSDEPAPTPEPTKAKMGPAKPGAEKVAKTNAVATKPEPTPAPQPEEKGFFAGLLDKVTGAGAPEPAPQLPTRKNPGVAGGYVPEAYIEQSENAFVVSRDSTPFYLFGPQQNRPADELLSTGTVVMMQKKTWGWAEVKLKDGRVGIVGRDALRHADANDLLAFAPAKKPTPILPPVPNPAGGVAAPGSLFPEAQLPIAQGNGAAGAAPSLLPSLAMPELPEPTLNPLPPASAEPTPIAPASAATPAPPTDSVKADMEALSNSLLPPVDRQ